MKKSEKKNAKIWKTTVFTNKDSVCSERCQNGNSGQWEGTKWIGTTYYANSHDLSVCSKSSGKSLKSPEVTESRCRSSKSTVATRWNGILQVLICDWITNFFNHTRVCLYVGVSLSLCWCVHYRVIHQSLNFVFSTSSSLCIGSPHHNSRSFHFLIFWVLENYCTYSSVYDGWCSENKSQKIVHYFGKNLKLIVESLIGEMSWQEIKSPK